MVNPGRPQPAVLFPIVSVHPAIHTLLIPSQNCQSARLPHPWRLDPFAVYPDPGPSPRPAPAPSIENLWSYPHPGRPALGDRDAVSPVPFKSGPSRSNFDAGSSRQRHHHHASTIASPTAVDLSVPHSGLPHVDIPIPAPPITS